MDIYEHPYWKSKRKKIFKRDNYKCTVCDSGNDLQVHHKKYIKGRKIWQYGDKQLITVCRKCHESIHHIKEMNELDNEFDRQLIINS